MRRDPSRLRRAPRRRRLASRRVRATDAPESGMGGGIGQWLLFRAGDGSLSLFSFVIPPGAETPVHDHLAWGLVGLYRGTQDEEIYSPRDGGLATRRAARARSGRLLRVPSTGERHPPRTNDVVRDLRLDPPVDERHGLHLAPRVRPGDRRAACVSLRATSTSSAPIRERAATVVLPTQGTRGTEGGGIRGHTRDTAGPEHRHQVVESQALVGCSAPLWQSRSSPSR